MTPLRLGLLVLMACALAGCGKSSSSDKSPPDLLRIEATGGSADSDSLLGSGGGGGDLTVRASGTLQFAVGENGPAAPSLPAAPTTGTELTNAMITAGTPIAGNVLVSSTLQINAGVNPAVITTNTGDVVILGSLIGERSAGTATNGITIQAPAGTIYVLGAIQTSGTAGTPDNPHAGNLSLTAQRIVITGTVDARGEDNSAALGGDGGSVTVDTTGGGGTEVLYAGGAILSSGGLGAGQGGDGGNITLLAGTKLSILSGVAADGGSANAYGVAATGGHAGDLALGAVTGIDIAASVTARGGAGTGRSNGAAGGDGGNLAIDSGGPCRIFGSLITSGGSVSASSGGPLTGGTAGWIRIGLVTPPTTLDLGRGSCFTNGGFGDQAGGGAGSMDVASLDGDITVGGAVTARGGDGVDSGGPGGSVTMTTDDDVLGNSSNHALTASTLIDTRGGSGTIGGDGGPVYLQCGADLSFTGAIATSGHAGGGHGGGISLVVDAANLAPTGALAYSGHLEAEGAGSGVFGLGNGGNVFLGSAGPLTFSAVLSTKGGGDAGHAGSVTLQAVSGDIHISGSISAVTHLPYAAPPTPGDVTVSTAGSIVSEAAINVSGGSPNPGDSNVRGGDGGAVSFMSTGFAGSISLLAGTDIKANGGRSTAGSSNHPGGAGGRILFSTVDQPVSITGVFLARGGAAPAGASNPGGLGGQVVVNSDSDGDGTGGAITLTAGSVIDVSGATGFDAGAALNNVGVAPANSSGTNLAVVFDAAGGLTASPDGGGEGIIRNLGTILATGGSLVARGGDIWFDGKNGSGANIGPGDHGDLVLDGNGGDGAFFPN